MLKVTFAVILLCSLALTSVSYACGYGFSGLNGRIYVYMSKPNDHLFAKDAGPPMHPLMITSAEEAASYFDEFALRTLDRRVDWSKQSLLVFAWTGAPDDSMQIFNELENEIDRLFLYTPGKHEGQRRHLEVYRIDHEMNWYFHALPARIEHLVDTKSGDLRDA
jgi:hypothetical protein